MICARNGRWFVTVALVLHWFAIQGGARADAGPEACFGFTPLEKIFFADSFEVTMTCEGSDPHPVRFSLQRSVPEDLSHPGFREALDQWIDEDQTRKTLPVNTTVRQWYHAQTLNKDVRALMDGDVFSPDGTWSRLYSVKEQNDPSGRPQWFVRLQEGEEKKTIPPCAVEGRRLQVSIKAQCKMHFSQEKSKSNAARYASLVKSFHRSAPRSFRDDEIASHALGAENQVNLCELVAGSPDPERYAHEFKIRMTPLSPACGSEDAREFILKASTGDPAQGDSDWQKFARSSDFEIWLGSDVPEITPAQKLWLAGQVLNSKLRSILLSLKTGDQVISKIQAEGLVRLHNELDHGNPIKVPDCHREFRVRIEPVCSLGEIPAPYGQTDIRYFALLLGLEMYAEDLVTKGE